jgi:hypothetical protein
MRGILVPDLVLDGSYLDRLDSVSDIPLRKQNDFADNDDPDLRNGITPILSRKELPCS